MGDSSVLSPFLPHIFSNTMKTACVLFLLLACLTALVVSQPRFSKLKKEEQRLGCSMDDIKKCEGEIVQAAKDCIHWLNIQQIMTCINDILGMGDCQKCICDVLPIC